MDKLLIFNFILIAIIVGLLWLVKKYAKTEKTKNLIFLVSAVVTILFHYSSLFIHCFDGTAIEYLKETPNLILPIYPCNVVMWSCLLYALIKNKSSRLGNFLADYIFWFGIISTLVGMFANVDFIRNPTLLDYDITKSIGAHATLLFSVLLLPIYGRIKIELKSNMLHIIVCIVEMFIVGAYCNLVFMALVSYETAYQVNSMFLIHSPFDGISFLTYPVIALIAIPLYFIVFAVCELFAYKKGERFYDRYFKTREN